MSIKDKVGESSSFGRARSRSERGRAKALTEGAIPAYELVRLPLDQVAATPLNPRRNFGSEEELTRFGEELREAQLAACVAVTRTAYLKLWPDHESQIGSSALYVLVNGERRFRSAVHVGLDKLDFVVRDDLAATREDFVDHLLAENLDREDFDVIERARGVEQLVSICAEDGGERGSRSRAAKRLGKDRSWVTNQLALLTLPTEIQVLLSAGEVSERDGRALARSLKEDPAQGASQLLDQLSKAKESAEQRKQEEQRLLAAGREALAQDRSVGMLSADNNPSSAGAETPAAAPVPAGETSTSFSLLSADNNETASTSQDDTTSKSTKLEMALPPATAKSDGVPEPREDNNASSAGAKSPAAAPVPAGKTSTGSSLLSADNNETASTSQDDTTSKSTKLEMALPPATAKSDGVPEPREEQVRPAPSLGVVTGVRFPYDNAVQAAQFLYDRMDNSQFRILVDILNGMAEERRGPGKVAAE